MAFHKCFVSSILEMIGSIREIIPIQIGLSLSDEISYEEQMYLLMCSSLPSFFLLLLLASFSDSLFLFFAGADQLSYEKALKEAGRTPAQPQPLEKVVDPVTGQIRFASRTEALSGRMTPASELQGLPAKEIQKRESVLPQATQSVKATEQNADSLIADLQALKDHAGLSGITGFIAGRTTNLSGPARSAQADFNKIQAQGTLGVLTALRAASKTGGALGNTSDKDVQLLKNAFGALDQTQNTEDFKKKLDDAIYATQRAKQNAREAYDSTYEYKTTVPGRPAPAAAAGGVVDFGSLQ